MRLKVGCDPEMFLRDSKTGKFVSAEGIVPGDKNNPFKVNKGTIQTDGFAAEIGITPASSASEFADNVQTVLEELGKYTKGYTIEFIDSVIFSEDVYNKQSETGRELGCMPDFNAYTKMANPVPQPNPKSFRTASGHIHIGWGEDMDINDPGHFADCLSVVKQLDWSVGAATAGWNPMSRRRELYGKAGAFRVKNYGCEYRTPDNTWLQKRELMEYVFNNTVLGITELYKGNHYQAQHQPNAYIDHPTYAGKGDQYLMALRIPILKYVTTATAAKPKAATTKKVA